MTRYTLALLALLATAPARAASTDTTAGASAGAWIDDYARQAESALRDLRTELDSAKRDADKIGADIQDATKRHMDSLDKQVYRSQKDLDRLKRTGELKASKARKRMDAAIEDLRREWEGLRKDLDEQERE